MNKRANTVGFHLYEVPRKGKFRDIKWNPGYQQITS